jgi:hypothetical protein
MVTTTADRVSRPENPRGLLDPRDLITTVLFDRLAGRISHDRRVERDYAERILSQTLAFLATCGRSPNTRLSPSATVDIGWHTFVLYTREYDQFCRRVAGRFIHHVPDDDQAGLGECDTEIPSECPIAKEPKGTTSAVQSIDATADAIAAAGWPVDRDLWKRSGECTGDCASDPPMHREYILKVNG